MTDVDTMAADMLRDLDGDLNEQGIHLVLRELKNRSARRSTGTSSHHGRSTRSLLPDDPCRRRRVPGRYRSGVAAPRTPEPGSRLEDSAVRP